MHYVQKEIEQEEIFHHILLALLTMVGIIAVLESLFFEVIS
jgi:hypothetical protein